MTRALAALACVGLLLTGSVLAEEKILRFESDIVISQDGSVLVTEAITVRAEGNRIQRGIYRDFPTRYQDRLGNDVEVVYRPLSLLRNDAPEDFFSERLSNGVRSYFGNADRMLPVGVHRYQFRYRVDRVLGFFEGHDELYWNVTGLDWAFPIETAGATVKLDFPGEPTILEADAYTGFSGDQGDDFQRRVSDATAEFTTTRELKPHEGLTVVVTWPKGFVAAPTGLDRLAWLLKDNANLLIVVSAFIVMLAYLIPVWNTFGKDPEEGLIVTRYEPPEGLSPASLRFIRQMYYDNKVMTTAVINLAVKGCLVIDESDGEHTLTRKKPDSDVGLAASERVLYEALFEDGSRLILDDKYHERIGGARKAHRRALRNEYRGRFFKTNGVLALPAFVVAVTSAIMAIKVGPGPTPLVIAGIVLLFATSTFFAVIMKRPTVLGRKTLDAVLGFREYLDIAEKDEVNLRNPPEKTPALFERYLPFALALGVEQRWSERFASVLARAQATSGGAYHPSWYNGSWNSFDMGRTTSAMSKSLSSAISSSATPPGSSSGGGGGGSSGGGGGGGGGGGW